MKRIFSAILFFALLPAVALAADTFEEGVQYDAVQPPQPTNVAPGKVEVLELFWYGCPHCYELEPTLDAWLQKKPDYIQFERMPAVLGENWRFYAQAYYAAEALGVLDKIHKPLFERIHKAGKPPATVDELAAFFADYGVKPDDFKNTFNSFGVLTKTARAMDMSKRYGIQGVPSFVVNGKYFTSPSQAQGRDKVFPVIEFLAQKEHAAATAK